MKRLFLLFIFSLLVTSCARVGSPNGGSRDSIAPQMLGSNIDSPNVIVPRDLKELRIDFDEYVMLNQVQKNLIISPPIKKIKKIFPSSLATKYVLIQWEDTLQENTTYNFNFGNAIKDNNEGNVLPYFNFAFSTGEKMDDLYISGDLKNHIINASNSKSSNSSSDTKNLVVGLYKESDSINYKQKPYYIAMADPDGYFELNYLSPGNYRLLAFEDANENSIFDTGEENVGFLKDSVVLDKSISGMQVNLFPSKPKFKYLETKEDVGGIVMLFQGNPDEVKVRSLNENLQDYKITHQPKSDSVKIWFDAQKDSIGIDKSSQLKFSYDTGIEQDTVSVFYRMNQKNEMQLSNTKGNLLPPKTDFEFASNYILDSINTKDWTLVSDSIAQPFTAKISEKNPFKVIVHSDFKEGKKYSLTVQKNSALSYYDQNPKAYRFDFEIGKAENYGNITFKLANIPQQKFWLQLLDGKNDVAYSRYSNDAEITFDLVKPETYTARILVDNNENGFWDPADFENQIFAEDIYEYSEKFTGRALWDITQNWDLKEIKKSEEPEEKPQEQPETTEVKEE